MKKVLVLLMVMFLSGCDELGTLVGSKKEESVLPNAKIGVLISGTKNPFFANAMKSFIQFKQNHPSVDVITNDANNNFDEQLRVVDEMIASGVQAIVINMVDAKRAEEVLQRVEQAKIPVVFFNRSPGQELLFSYDKAIFIDGDAVQGGVMQGQAVLKGWKAHPEWDKNKDGKIQYAMLMGFENNPSAIARTRWSTSTMSSFPALGVPVEEVAFQVANFSADQAYDAVSGWVSEGKSHDIEVILANNDMMAIGALKAVKASNMNMPIFGIDAIPEAQKLVKKGELTNTVVNDVSSQADACIFAAINLIYGKAAHSGTHFRTDYQTILVPYKSLESL